LFHDESRRLTCQVIRLDWSSAVGYARMCAAPVRVGLRTPPLTWGLGSGGCFLQAGLRRQVLQRWDLGHALGGEHAPALKLPVLVLLQQHRSHQALDRRIVGEDAHHAGAALDFLVDALEQVGAPDLFPVLGREVTESEHVLAGLDHQLSRPGELGSEHGAHLIPLLQDRLLALLREHRAQGSGHHLLVGFWHRLEKVPGEMHAAALPAAALQHPADRVDQTAVGIADHQLDPSEATLFEGANELAPEALAFAVTHLEAEQFPAAIGIDAHGHHHRPGADLHGTAQAPVEVGGVEIEVGVALPLKRSVQEGLHLQIDLSADTAHLGFRDPALGAESGDQGIDLARGDAGDIGLHHDGVEGLIYTAAGLQDRGQKAA